MAKESPVFWDGRTWKKAEEIEVVTGPMFAKGDLVRHRSSGETGIILEFRPGGHIYLSVGMREAELCLVRSDCIEKVSKRTRR